MTLLRPYQAELVEKVEASSARSVLVVLPTGAGKTRVAEELTARETARGGRVVFLADRQELIRQAHDRIGGTVVMGSYRPTGGIQRPDSPGVTIASVATLARRSEAPDATLVFADECVTGDTLVATPNGGVPIDALRTGDIVLCYNGQSCVTKRIRRHLSKGPRPVLLVKFQSGRSLRCTAEHPVMAGSGWIRAGDLRAGTEVFALADAENRPSPDYLRATFRHSSKDTVSGGGARPRTGSNDIRRRWRGSRLVLAAVANGSRLHMGPRSTSSSVQGASLGTTPISSDIDAGKAGSFLVLSDRPSSGRSSGTPASFFRTREAKTLGCLSTTVFPKENGRCTRRLCCSDWRHTYGSRPTEGTGTVPCQSPLAACHASRISCHSCSGIEKSESQPSGSMQLEGSGSPGGLGTMGVARLATPSAYTLKDTQKKTCASRRRGSNDTTGPHRSQPNGGTTSLISSPTPASEFSRQQDRISPSAWHTNFDLVESLSPDGCEEVFDIEVEEHHNFFANGVLVHNCHLYMASSFRRILDAYRSSGARVVGLTATPARLDGQGLGMLFDEVIQGPSTADLISLGFLCPVRTFAPTGAWWDSVRLSGGDFDAGELEHAAGAVVRDVASSWRRLGGASRPTIVFAATKRHARELAVEFSGLSEGLAEVVTDDTPQSVRRSVRDRIESGALRVVVTVGVLGTGFDAPSVSCIVMARPTLSWALYLQQGGRGMRTSEGKPDLLLIDAAGNSLRHGLLTKPFSVSLDGIQRKHRRAVAGLTTCRSCFRVYESTEPLCPGCGSTRPRVAPRTVKTVDGQLVEMTGAQAYAERTKNDPHVSTLAKFLAMGKERNWKPNAPMVRFLGTFKRWPSKQEIEQAQRAVAQ